MSLLGAGHRAHDLSRGAVTALKPVVLNESSLHRMEPITRTKALYRSYGRSTLGGGKRQARDDPPTVDKHGARPTLSKAAAFLGAGEMQPVAEAVEQGGAGVQTDELVFDSVHAYR